ncbi:Sec-independent protein translocase protein TatB [Methylophilus glucosoxydans]|uniref:Sec-independent protein translocase protein TatB n=1 Tax=Methylophilus glucosoxydans TaxID=752553 RepID=A0ABW3GKK7_9PROT|nr:Sec-independent protein translocase protein TatB [Methylophilus sp. VKM B-3414]MBF5039693.1 twin-arginine translocase subunit TatB [Methylophilus sp. 13]MDT7848935.1 Sec-independent protein translocase protein TatB [Methylophilus sp. VKM B-3414]
MFDISFSELLVIALVALVVIGPEKLPKVARTAGAFFGRMQRFVSQVKDEVNREARFAELQQLQDEVKSGLQSVYDDAAQHILPENSIAETSVQPEKVVEPVKPSRKPRQRKSSPVNDEQPAEAAVPSALVVSESAPAPQAELFAEAPAAKPRQRRARQAAKTANDTPPNEPIL